MGKYLCWTSLGIAGFMLLLFLADLIFKRPFAGMSPTVDVLGILSSGIVGYLSWEASRELR